MRKLLTVLCLASVSVAASSQNLAPLLGLPLGKPLDRDIPACTDQTVNGSDFCSSSKRAKKGKVTSLSLLPPSSTSDRALPAWVQADYIQVESDNAGNIGTIRVKASGPSEQASTISSIERRFGKPTSVVTIEKRNAFGATWSVIHAMWGLPGIWINHDCYEINACWVVFSTQRHQAEMTARLRSADKRPAAP